ncbi:unnamed protein product [Clonostachys solani]|uniref:Heterokaryon incompatibility domain-containing protein n=1 Tax=Clonostachys solani TaxID=160281 RepID=A0A9N9ZKQ4_9HYPO|nr:unnamed protein product [Clonostachys solani]
MKPTTAPAQLPIRTLQGTEKSASSCALNWDRRQHADKEDRDSLDLGEWTTFEALEAEVQRGCDKCTVIYKGTQLYRPEFEGRSNGAYIHQTDSGITCSIQRKLQKGEMSVSPVDLRFFRAADQPCQWLPALHHPQVRPNTNCPETFQQLRDWISTCDKDHEVCLVSSTVSLPTRILDLGGTDEEHADAKLRNGQNESGRYATLSHCWGGYQPLKTTKSTLDAHTANIPFQDLPKTFQDAAITCRRLGIRFLWIDSLCIIQDDDEDWQIQSAQMASIYENSTLTIAASSAQNATRGCFLPVPDRHAAHTVAWPGTLQQSSYSVSVYRSYPHFSFWEGKHVQQQAPLLTRAWFYQERYLSRRVVHFTENELVWECQTVATCQCQSSHFEHLSSPSAEYTPMDVINRNQLRLQPKLPDHINHRDKRDADPWHLCVRAYSQLSLTFPKDIFPALAGLASKVQLLKPGARYCAGLWLDLKTNNLNDLAWINEGIPRSRQKRWRAPTWSWASVVECFPSWADWIDLDPSHTYAKLLEAKVKSFGLDPNGELRDAFIRVQGPMAAGFIQKPTLSIPDKNNVLHPRGAEVYIRGEPYRLPPLVRLDVNPELCEPKLSPGAQVYCLRLGRAVSSGSREHDISLCLRVVDEEDGEPIFERIGLAHHDHVLDPTEPTSLYSVKIV